MRPGRLRRLSGVDRYLLDTTVLIDLSKNYGDVPATLEALAAARQTLAVCAVSVAEFFAGIPVRQRPRWERWITDFEYWHIPREAATLAGVFRHDRRRRGRALRVPDALIAATAVVADATLITNNVKDYPMPDLKLWRLGA